MHQLFSGLCGKLFGRGQKRPALAARRRYRPEVLPLEERVVLSSSTISPVPIFLNPVNESSLVSGDFSNNHDDAYPLPVIQDTVIVNGKLDLNDRDWFKITTTVPNQSIWAYVDTGGVQNPGARPISDRKAPVVIGPRTTRARRPRRSASLPMSGCAREDPSASAVMRPAAKVIDRSRFPMMRGKSGGRKDV